MATDPEKNKEAKDEKPKEDVTEEQLEDVAGGRQKMTNIQRDSESRARIQRSRAQH